MAKKFGESPADWPPSKERQDADARRLLGLDEKWKILEGAEKERLLPSVARRKAFDNITAETGPKRINTERKKGLASAILERGFLNEEILKRYPTIYLGSLLDVEYPLALGSRHTVLVDYQLSLEKDLPVLAEKLKKLSSSEPLIEGNRATVTMDLGSGPEEVSFEIEAKWYNPDEEAIQKIDPEILARIKEYQLPDKIGLLLAYAPGGPLGGVDLEPNIERKIVDGGAILFHRKLTHIKGGYAETIEIKPENEIQQ